MEMTLAGRLIRHDDPATPRTAVTPQGQAPQWHIPERWGQRGQVQAPQTVAFQTQRVNETAIRQRDPDGRQGLLWLHGRIAHTFSLAFGCANIMPWDAEGTKDLGPDSTGSSTAIFAR